MADAALLHEATPGDTRYARWALREWSMVLGQWHA